MMFRLIAVSFAMFFASTVQAVDEHRPLRILLNNGDDTGSEGCTIGDVQVIKEALFMSEAKDDERRLQYGPLDDPCTDRCHGWPPGYCFWYFCSWSHLYHRQLSEEEGSQKPLEDCAGDLVVVNNVLNKALPLVSTNCQAILMANRAFQCH